MNTPNDTIQKHLLNKAEKTAHWLLSEHPVLPTYKDHLSVLLIGSLGAGYADSRSDIDLWVLCSDEVSESVSEHYTRNELRFDSMPPHKLTQDGTEVHYFTFPIGKMRRMIESYDDDSLFVASHCVTYHDANNQFLDLSMRFTNLPDEVLREKITDAYTWVAIHAASLQEMLHRYQPSLWLETISALVQSTLKLGCWLNGQAPAPPKWTFRQLQSCSTGQILLPAIKQLLHAAGALMEYDSPHTGGVKQTVDALASLDRASRKALDASGYHDIPTPALHRV